ncbi:MAG: hypothetical protein GY882_03300 [Actinomycetia bacterium]|nr:hypothetical protein [Actinomycetes bacterium]MCP4844349.1 hypothetical protein [Actinomycetes bacterium]
MSETTEAVEAETTEAAPMRPAVELLVAVGTAAATLPEAIRTVHVGESHNADEFTAAFEAAKLTSLDLRCATVVSVTEATPGVLGTYVGLCAVAGRLLDLDLGARRIVVGPIAAAVEQLVANSPKASVEVAFAGNHHAGAEGATVRFDQALTAADVKLLRWAKVASFAPSADAYASMTQLVIVGLIRQRPTGIRWPLAETATVEADLAAIDAAALEMRRQSRSADAIIVEADGDLNEDAELLVAAAKVDIVDVLAMLKARQAGNGNWHCPRPRRHNNGDATASAKVRDTKFRCFKCDGEDVDGLRLVMDVFAVAPWEAARWIAVRAARNAQN